MPIVGVGKVKSHKRPCALLIQTPTIQAHFRGFVRLRAWRTEWFVPLHARVFKITESYAKNKVMEMGSSSFLFTE
jgi:hypothetical protein